MRANEFFELMDYNKKMKYSSGDVMRMMEAYKEHCFKAENLPISDVSKCDICKEKEAIYIYIPDGHTECEGCNGL